jgi:hypothetical protein
MTSPTAAFVVVGFFPPCPLEGAMRARHLTRSASGACVRALSFLRRLGGGWRVAAWGIIEAFV